MKRNNAEQIGELIRHYLRQESLESPLNERRLISAWPEVLGPTIASYTRELYIKHPVLYVHLTSAALRQVSKSLLSCASSPMIAVQPALAAIRQNSGHG